MADKPVIVVTVEGFAAIVDGHNFQTTAASIDWGDGDKDEPSEEGMAVAGGRLVPLRHEYLPGSYTIKVWAGDRDGKADATAKVDIG